MIKESEKRQILNWGNYFLTKNAIWEESDTCAIKALLISLGYKTPVYSIGCREYLKWGWFYMENSPDYDPDREFLVFDVMLSIFDEDVLIDIAKHVLPVARPIPSF
jgi:hypothetical protein